MTLLTFTTAQADQLGRTADALSAWLGKPVLAEIVAEPEAGYEWALFAIPLAPQEEPGESAVRVQVGGPRARLLGSRGGLGTGGDAQPLDCTLLWAVQRSNQPGRAYVKIDASGEEVAWSDDLPDLLPFDLHEPDLPDDEDENGDDT